LICRKPDGAILGAINLNEIIRGPAQSAFLGYWIGAAHARQGYMTEALSLALRHAFGSLRLHRVEANILPVNVPSIALVRRAGFHYEGYSPGYLKIDGRWEDHERWALVADRWKRRREKIGGGVRRSQGRAARSQP
ncbi:MAG TPA: GNAT family protein, partial [Methylomirabilota bacterium]|nr:GNAT family protein [Methylomirabilota bacterium]